jgi:hypothetical protein
MSAGEKNWNPTNWCGFCKGPVFIHEYSQEIKVESETFTLHKTCFLKYEKNPIKLKTEYPSVLVIQK